MGDAEFAVGATRDCPECGDDEMRFTELHRWLCYECGHVTWNHPEGDDD